MGKRTHSPTQKRAYFRKLRDSWKESKELANNDQEAQAIHREACPNMSYYGFYFALLSMKAQNLDGIPHVDCKTFMGWKEAGFQVQKGERAKVTGITWIHPKDADGEEDEGKAYPKAYKLFHRTQVKPL